MIKSKEITIKARRFDPRDEETIDLKYFDMVEVVAGGRRIVIRIEDGQALTISADDQLILHLRGANKIEIPL